VETSAITYRVADFLKAYPPFQAMDTSDLLALAGNGRVRFYQANEYLLWQGEPHKSHVFVIQQGTVSLWDEAGGQATLRDVRGAGDMLGLERYAEGHACRHTAMSESDVVVYTFPASDFDALVEKYPYARAFVETDDVVTSDYQWTKDARDPQNVFLQDVIRSRPLARHGTNSSIREVARALVDGREAIAIVDDEDRVRGIATPASVLSWVASGGGNVDQPAAAALLGPPPAIGTTARVTDGVLAIGETSAAALAVTSDGSQNGRLAALVTPGDLSRVFGDQPTAILKDIHLAGETSQLRELTHRSRALVLQYLTTATTVDWLARFVSLTDAAVLRRLITLSGGEHGGACWCTYGAAGRNELLTRQAPQLVVIAEDETRRDALRHVHERVSEGLAACDYVPNPMAPFEPSFHVASRAEWQTRFGQWVYDPVRTEMFLARPLFDLRPVHGDHALWLDVERSVSTAVDNNFLHVLANDCLTNMPPLAFFQDAVVEKSGEHATVFRLESSALQPLVDVGRVFGMASRKALGTSTLERFAAARTLLPEHEAIFREASQSLRVLLWQQGRIGISRGTSGDELPPSLLSRQDRHLLKSCFRSILRLVELTGNAPWFAPA
jgi:CBS domain-containing protein